MTDHPRFRELAHETRFTFVRHGESEANRLGIVQGHKDSPLSQAGREHARAAGRWLTDEGVELVFTSPLSRSRETATILAEVAGVRMPVTLDELIEIDTGVYSGENIRDKAQTDPEAYKEFLIHSWEAVDGAEGKSSILDRAMTVWDRLVTEENAGRRHIVCVTHGGMLQWLIKATIGGRDQRWMPIFTMDNCGISTFQAESTSLGHDEEVPPGAGYYGNWTKINHVPY
jgi:broad specificity phosphatase PhoE